MSSARVLIIDDEPALIILLRRYMTRLGFEVDTASTAEEALTLFTQDPDKYACVLTDLKLPGMGGEELLERLRELRPGLPALITSGYPYRPNSPATGFLQKPYLPGVLAEELERLLRRTAKSE